MTVLTVPNLLTLSRMVLTVCFFSAGLQARWDWACLLFLIAAITDMIDGTVARLFKQKSRFGAFIDPMADKLMMLGGITILTINLYIPWWLMAIIVGRDLVIVNALFYMMYRKIEVDYRPTKLSKTTTLIQISTIVAGFLTALQATWPYYPAWAIPLTKTLPWLIAAATVLTLITLVQYSIVGIRILRSEAATDGSKGQI